MEIRRAPILRLALAAAVCLVATVLDLALGQPSTIVIGRTISLSGAFQSESKILDDGFRMWHEDVQARGGILMKDGMRHPVKVVTRNDASDPQIAGLQVDHLVSDEGAHVLVGPFGAAMAQVAVKRANVTQTPIVYAAASSMALFNSGYTHSFSIQAQIGKRQATCISLFANSTARTVELIVANDSFQLTAAKTFRAGATAAGMNVVRNHTYPIDEALFSNTTRRWRDSPSSRPDVVLVGGPLQFSIEAVRAIRKIYDPKAIFIANGGSLPGLISELGWESGHLFQGVQWDSVLDYRDEYYGSTRNFAAEFRKRTGTDVFFTSAASYASGYAIEKALEAAESLGSSDIIAAIRSLGVSSAWGQIKFLPSGELDGRIICEQVINRRIEIVAPQTLATARLVYPAYPIHPPPPKFSEREIMLMKVLTPSLFGAVLIGVGVGMGVFIYKKYYLIAVPKSENNDEWGRPRKDEWGPPPKDSSKCGFLHW